MHSLPINLTPMNVFLTGADGFMGSHLAEELVRAGHQVKALCIYNSIGSHGWLDTISPEVKSQMEIVMGDIRDPYHMAQLVKGQDAILHLAALIAIPFSYVAPDMYVQTNIQGTLNLLNAARDAGVSRFIHTSTSEVYGTAQYVPIDEKHPLQPQSPYSASKIGADAMAMSFYNAFDLPVTIARPFNTYGPRQSARAIIPTIISQIASGMPQILLGDVSPTRDFNYVEDTCRGFLALARCDKAVGETVNIGSNHEISILDTLKLIREIMGSQVEFVTDEQRLRPGKSEVFRLWCNNTRIRELTGFAPIYNLRQGLQATVEWFTQPTNLAKYRADIYNV